MNLDRKVLLQAALGSLCREQGCDFEVIVVDNGSRDGSPEWVCEFASSAPFPTRLIRNEQNLGFCAANNQGIAAARGEFVALLNNDAEVEPGWLGALAAVFRHPGVGMAASKILVWEDPEIIDKAGHLIWLDGQNRGRGTGERDTGQYDREEDVLWPDGCAAMYRKSMLDRIGLFDEDLFAYGDDADLGLRARIAGWRCVYTPRAVVRHHRGATLGQQNPLRVKLIERNRVLLAVKLFPGSLLWLNGVFFVARAAGGAWASLRNRGELSKLGTAGRKARALLALLQGQWEALRMVGRTWAKRRAFRPLRRLSPAETRRLLWHHRISLRALSEQTAHSNLQSTPPKPR